MSLPFGIDLNCSGVYRITNTMNGHAYIGSAVNIRKRLYNHRWRLSNNCHGNAHLQNAWNKHGADSFTFETILLCDKSMTLYYEQVCLDGLEPVYNMLPTAGSNLGMKFNDAARANMSKAHMGKPSGRLGCTLTEEHKRKLSLAGLGHTNNLGHKHSDAVREKMSLAQKGELSPNFGKPGHMLGKHHTAAARERMSESAIRAWAERKNNDK